MSRRVSPAKCRSPAWFSLGWTAMLAAVQRGLPIMTYAEALGACMAGRTGVAIAGTHGKSTTVGMLGHALIVQFLGVLDEL